MPTLRNSTKRPLIKNKIRRKGLNIIFTDWRLLNRQLKLGQIRNPRVKLATSDGTIIDPKFENRAQVIDHYLDPTSWITRDDYKAMISSSRPFQLQILQYKNMSTDDDRVCRMTMECEIHGTSSSQRSSPLILKTTRDIRPKSAEPLSAASSEEDGSSSEDSSEKSNEKSVLEEIEKSSKTAMESDTEVVATPRKTSSLPTLSVSVGMRCERCPKKFNDCGWVGFCFHTFSKLKLSRESLESNSSGFLERFKIYDQS